MNIAVIPARGGSKRIPKKNLRQFAGKPILLYSIEAALESGLFQHVIVSTDCPAIAELATKHGGEVPFLRPVQLADDFTPTVPVVRHAIDQLAFSADIQHVCCLYATAPFVRASDLRETLFLLQQTEGLDFAFPVTSFSFPIFRALQFDESSTGGETPAETETRSGAGGAKTAEASAGARRVSMIWEEHEQTRSQDLPEAIHDAGQFYWGRAAAWRNCDRIYSSNSAGYLIPRYRVQDLDTNEDWLRAEAMFRAISQTEI